MNRGRARQKIFHGPAYYSTFLQTLEETHNRFDAQIHAYCLMGNYYHLLMGTPRANLELSQVLSQRPDNTEIVNAVSRVFKINAEEIVKKGRGRAEVMLARQMAIYCSQQLGDQSLRELARNFNFSHEGSASSAIAATKRRLENGELAKEYGSVERLLNILIWA